MSVIGFMLLSVTVIDALVTACICVIAGVVVNVVVGGVGVIALQYVTYMYMNGLCTHTEFASPDHRRIR